MAVYAAAALLLGASATQAQTTPTVTYRVQRVAASTSGTKLVPTAVNMNGIVVGNVVNSSGSIATGFIYQGGSSVSFTGSLSGITRVLGISDQASSPQFVGESGTAFRGVPGLLTALWTTQVGIRLDGGGPFATEGGGASSIKKNGSQIAGWASIRYTNGIYRRGAVLQHPTDSTNWLHGGIPAGFNESRHLALNGSGVTVGHAFTEPAWGQRFGISAPYADRAMHWSQSRVITNLGTLPGYAQSRATAINDSGLVLGTAYNAPGGFNFIDPAFENASETRAFLWTNNQLSPLVDAQNPSLPTRGLGLNTFGDILLQSGGGALLLRDGYEPGEPLPSGFGTTFEPKTAVLGDDGKVYAFGSIGGASGEGLLKFTPYFPVPRLQGVSPAAVLKGSGLRTLTLTGQGFYRHSVAQLYRSDFSGPIIPLTTRLVSRTQLSVDIPAEVTAEYGNWAIRVNNPALTPPEQGQRPDGGISPEQQGFLVGRVAPKITRITPDRVAVGTTSIELTVYGENFVPGPPQDPDRSNIAVTDLILDGGLGGTLIFTGATRFISPQELRVTVDGSYLFSKPLVLTISVYTRYALEGAGSAPLTVFATPSVQLSSNLTRQGNEIVAQITALNDSSVAVSDVRLATAQLGTVAAVPLPASFGNLAAGTSATVEVRFPAPAAGTRTVLSLGGAFTGGTFSSSRRVVVP